MILKAILIFALLFLFMMMGAPMAIALGASTVITLVCTTSLGITTIATACFSGLDSFPLLAVPFFILAGNLMKFGGLSNKILEFADALVGHIKGSLGMVAVVASMFFAALSGSSPATVSAIGSLTIPKMEEEGYDRAYATALNAAAGTIGVIIPPSIPFVIYGVVANCSIADMFKAGILPGILIGVVLMIVNYIAVTKNGYGMKNQANKHFSFRKLGKTLKETWLALMVPVIILGGIYAGIFTPTESAVVFLCQVGTKKILRIYKPFIGGQPPVNGLRFLYALLPFFVRRFLYAVSNASIIGVTGSSLSGLDRYSNRMPFSRNFRSNLMKEEVSRLIREVSRARIVPMS